METKIWIAVCDDEEDVRKTVIEYCKMFFEEKEMCFEVLEFSSGEDVVEYEGQIDILLLDIEMKGMNGIKVKDLLMQQNRKSAIVYVTSHDDFMRSAFGKNVYDYIKKPICEKDLNGALELICKDRMKQRLIKISEDLWIKFNDIHYIRSEDKYCKIYTEDNEYLLRRRISDLEKEFMPNDFIRAQKSYLVNLRYVKKIGQTVIMDDDTIIKIARGKIDLLRHIYNEYVFSNAY